MLKQILHKILASFLALVVLFSSLSFTVNQHLCHGKVVSTSYFTKAKSCGMNIGFCKNDNSSESHLNRTSCCKDITEFIQGNDTEQQALACFEMPQIQFVTAFICPYIIPLSTYVEKDNFSDYHPPPLIDKDIQVLYQTFLI